MQPDLRPTFCRRFTVPAAVLLLVMAAALIPSGSAALSPDLPPDLAPFFKPPAEFEKDLGSYRSPLRFEDGRTVRTAAQWKERRREILRAWHRFMGEWPPLIKDPRIEVVSEEPRETFQQQTVRIQVAPDRTAQGYLLLPPGRGRLPAVVVVFYEPETAIGKGSGPERDFAYQLAKRGFVTLSIGFQAERNYYPDEKQAALQPLSFMAYMAANCYEALARHPRVDKERVGIVGHSYGGKWAMFASCLYEKFACAAWSDGGIVFDETRPNVNYWEPWYLGYEQGKKRTRGVPTSENPTTGVYRELRRTGHDLHELHALMAPRPFLVSGGSEDPSERWKALNHTVQVNRLLGHSGRSGMTNRPGHGPTPESNAVLYRFFEHFLRVKEGGQGD